MEIMLVLAIAAMIIVMSVRYYQSASAAQRANACMSYLQAVVAAADSLSEATQSYSDITSSEIDAIVPPNAAVCSDLANGTIGGTSNDHFAIYIILPEQACSLLFPKLIASGHWFWNPQKGTLEDTCSRYTKSSSSAGNHNNIYYFRSKQTN